MPQGQPISSSSLRNFITLELTAPRQILHRAAKLVVKVQSFEAVVWLPIVDVVSSVLSSVVLSRGEEVKVCACVYVCVNILHICLFFCVCKCMYMYVHVPVYKGVCAYMCVYIGCVCV